MIKPSAVHKNARLALLFAFLVVAGCSGPAQTRLPQKASDPDQESVIFGRLIMDWRNTQFRDAVDRQGEMILSLLHDASGEQYDIVSQDNHLDSRFFAQLPPGKYRLVKWQKGKFFRNMYVSFKVRRGQVAYIGTLKWVRGPFDRLPGNLLIEDRYTEEAAYFKTQFPNIVQQPGKSIVHLD